MAFQTADGSSTGLFSPDGSPAGSNQNAGVTQGINTDLGDGAVEGASSVKGINNDSVGAGVYNNSDGGSVTNAGEGNTKIDRVDPGSDSQNSPENFVETISVSKRNTYFRDGMPFYNSYLGEFAQTPETKNQGVFDQDSQTDVSDGIRSNNVDATAGDTVSNQITSSFGAGTETKTYFVNANTAYAQNYNVDNKNDKNSEFVSDPCNSCFGERSNGMGPVQTGSHPCVTVETECLSCLDGIGSKQTNVILPVFQGTVGIRGVNDVGLPDGTVNLKTGYWALNPNTIVSAAGYEEGQDAEDGDIKRGQTNGQCDPTRSGPRGPVNVAKRQFRGSVDAGANECQAGTTHMVKGIDTPQSQNTLPVSDRNKRVASLASVVGNCTFAYELRYLGESWDANQHGNRIFCIDGAGNSGVQITAYEKRLKDDGTPAGEEGGSNRSGPMSERGNNCANSGYYDLYACGFGTGAADINGNVDGGGEVYGPLVRVGTLNKGEFQDPCTCQYRYLRGSKYSDLVDLAYGGAIGNIQDEFLPVFATGACSNPNILWNDWDMGHLPAEGSPATSHGDDLVNCGSDIFVLSSGAGGTGVYWSDEKCDWMIPIQAGSTVEPYDPTGVCMTVSGEGDDFGQPLGGLSFDPINGFTEDTRSGVCGSGPVLWHEETKLWQTTKFVNSPYCCNAGYPVGNCDAQGTIPDFWAYDIVEFDSFDNVANDSVGCASGSFASGTQGIISRVMHVSNEFSVLEARPGSPWILKAVKKQPHFTGGTLGPNGTSIFYPPGLDTDLLAGVGYGVVYCDSWGSFGDCKWIAEVDLYSCFANSGTGCHSELFGESQVFEGTVYVPVDDITKISRPTWESNGCFLTDFGGKTSGPVSLGEGCPRENCGLYYGAESEVKACDDSECDTYFRNPPFALGEFVRPKTLSAGNLLYDEAVLMAALDAEIADPFAWATANPYVWQVSSYVFNHSPGNPVAESGVDCYYTYHLIGSTCWVSGNGVGIHGTDWRRGVPTAPEHAVHATANFNPHRLGTEFHDVASDTPSVQDCAAAACENAFQSGLRYCNGTGTVVEASDLVKYPSGTLVNPSAGDCLWIITHEPAFYGTRASGSDCGWEIKIRDYSQAYPQGPTITLRGEGTSLPVGISGCDAC
jgi:hypothetical protein